MDASDIFLPPVTVIVVGWGVALVELVWPLPARLTGQAINP